MQRRTWIAAAGPLSLAPWWSAAVEPPRATLPRPRSLRWLDQAVAGDRVLVVMFTQPGCAVCEAVRRSHLLPMAAELAQQDKLRGSSPSRRRIQLIEIDITASQAFEDFPRQSKAEPPRWKSSPKSFAQSLGIRLTPTLAFFGAQGEVAERLTGYMSDFYGGYLEQRIETALAASKS